MGTRKKIPLEEYLDKQLADVTWQFRQDVTEPGYVNVIDAAALCVAACRDAESEDPERREYAEGLRSISDFAKWMHCFAMGINPTEFRAPTYRKCRDVAGVDGVFEFDKDSEFEPKRQGH